MLHNSVYLSLCDTVSASKSSVLFLWSSILEFFLQKVCAASLNFIQISRTSESTWVSTQNLHIFLPNWVKFLTENTGVMMVSDCVLGESRWSSESHACLKGLNFFLVALLTFIVWFEQEIYIQFCLSVVSFMSFFWTWIKLHLVLQHTLGITLQHVLKK